MKMFEVGGACRDEYMGVKSDDIDFSVVLEDADIAAYSAHNTFTPYEYMVFALEGMGIKIFKNDGVPIGAEHITARGQAPKDFPKYPGRALDFVLARREGKYSDGRRPDTVEPGTLVDDIFRRDFTMNALAKDSNGKIIDLVGGQQDIDDRIIRAVGDPVERLTEDALRAVRALRFAVTKDFDIATSLKVAMEHPHVIYALLKNISDDRINRELSKMFRFNTIESMRIMTEFPVLTDAIFAGSVSLDSTLKTKGRGK